MFVEVFVGELVDELGEDINERLIGRLRPRRAGPHNELDALCFREGCSFAEQARFADAARPRDCGDAAAPGDERVAGGEKRLQRRAAADEHGVEELVMRERVGQLFAARRWAQPLAHLLNKTFHRIFDGGDDIVSGGVAFARIFLDQALADALEAGMYLGVEARDVGRELLGVVVRVAN